MKVAITVTVRSTGLILMTSNLTFSKKIGTRITILDKRMSSKFVGEKKEWSSIEFGGPKQMLS